jgi:hypothetical protein
MVLVDSDSVPMRKIIYVSFKQNKLLLFIRLKENTKAIGLYQPSISL